MSKMMVTQLCTFCLLAGVQAFSVIGHRRRCEYYDGIDMHSNCNVQFYSDSVMHMVM